MYHRARLKMLMAACAVALTACGGSGGGDSSPPAPAPAPPVEQPPAVTPNSGNASDCFGAQMHADGAGYTATYALQNDRQRTVQYAVKSPASFAGQDGLIEISETITESDATSSGTPPEKTVQAVRYIGLDGMVEVEYGSVTTVLRDTYATPPITTPGEPETAVLTPPTRNPMYTLTPDNQSHAFPGDAHLVVNYLGQETIATAAGSFDTCKFSHFPGDTAKPSVTEWRAKGSGIVVQTGLVGFFHVAEVTATLTSLTPKAP
ncbi:MAG: hypothetical protein Q4G71_08555 [Pseudomonadota bacterium]|nr:hypothetical protein [Pseudomonadota bacterium]